MSVKKGPPCHCALSGRTRMASQCPHARTMPTLRVKTRRTTASCSPTWQQDGMCTDSSLCSCCTTTSAHGNTALTARTLCAAPLSMSMRLTACWPPLGVAALDRSANTATHLNTHTSTKELLVVMGAVDSLCSCHVCSCHLAIHQHAGARVCCSHDGYQR